MVGITKDRAGATLRGTEIGESRRDHDISASRDGPIFRATADFNSTFTRVANELHSQYVLGFSPATLDGKLHKLDVRVKQPGAIARTRKSYLASK